MDHQPLAFNYLKFSKNTKVPMDELYSGLQHPELSMINTVNELIVTLNAHVIGYKLEPRVFTDTKTEIQTVPKTWWDHWKLAYSKSWWNPFHKINYRTITFEAKLKVTVDPTYLFPESELTFPLKLGKPIKMDIAYLEDEVVKRYW